MNRLLQGVILSSPWDRVEICHMATGQCLQSLNHLDEVGWVAYSADSRQLVSRSVKGISHRCHLETGQCLKTSYSHIEHPVSLDFSADLLQMAAGTVSAILVAHEGERPSFSLRCQLLTDSRGDQAPVGQIALSPNSEIVAAAHGDGTIGIYDSRLVRMNSWCLRTRNSHTGANLVAFSPGSDLLASASDDGSIKTWEVATGKFKQKLKGHSRRVNSIAFSPDSNLMASASDDPTIRVWDLQTSECLYRLTDHFGPMLSVVFSAQFSYTCTLVV
ncbi:WD40 repeat-like protein [Parathielavia hyrcaniae]|uniref:Mitochondrial division protein 1 n=1 Tax=Parathielavia hyrcaniae TaxID=113614 RepID=A0AAN6Q3X8_9PEZI|nr:WD40 repeat-like protein [Parathielavia hyrcaniae]